MNKLVRIIVDDDGFKKLDSKVWHLVDPVNEQGPAAFCTQEFFGAGESRVEYEEKTVPKGGITCPDCIRKLKQYKAVKL